MSQLGSQPISRMSQDRIWRDFRAAYGRFKTKRTNECRRGGYVRRDKFLKRKAKANKLLRKTYSELFGFDSYDHPLKKDVIAAPVVTLDTVVNWGWLLSLIHI